MTQTFNLQINPLFLDASNTGLFIGATETIIINKLPFGGTASGIVFIKNYIGSAGNITNVNLYGSADGISYALITSNIFGGSIAPDAFSSASITAVVNYIRLTASSSSGTSNLDVFVNATRL
jgi:hypothetical protein